MVTYFITGASKGFGKILAEELLTRGHKVIASARSEDHLVALREAGAKCVAWNVTSPLEVLEAFAQAVIREYGPIDVLVNNAGYFQQGILEECTPDEMHMQFSVNVFGLMNTTKAFLPHMRARKSGTILNMGSVGAYFSAPLAGLYCASKAAVRGVSEAFRQELEQFGITVLLVEPGYFRTEFMSRTSARNSRSGRIAAYDDMSARISPMMDGFDGAQPGDPGRGCAIIADYLERSGAFKGADRPTWLCLGKDAYGYIEESANSTLRDLKKWKQVTDQPVYPSSQLRYS